MTKTPPSLLHPGPWLSGALLLVATGSSFAIAQLIARTAGFAGITSPRIGALVGFAMIATPIVLVAGAHHTTQKVLDRMGGEKTSHGAWPGLTSWWAGVFAWLAASLVSCVLFFAAGISDAGHVTESVSRIFVRSSLLDLVSWPTLVWVLAAGSLYVFERQAKHAFASTKAPANEAPWKFYAASFGRAVVLTAFLAEIAVSALALGFVAAMAAERESHVFAATLGALTIVSPIVFVALGDHGVRHVLRLFGKPSEGLGMWPGIRSWWTGLFSWFVLMFGGLSTFAIHGVLFGNVARVDMHAAIQPVGSPTVVFAVIATALFHMEACVRRRLATAGE